MSLPGQDDGRHPERIHPRSAGRRFDRAASASAHPFTCIGSGSLGGKAAGLAFVQEALESAFPEGRHGEIRISIPQMTVLLAGVFEEFLALNDLEETAASELEDEMIARRFQKADLPATIVGDLLSLISSCHEPLAIRSSSLLEDSLQAPLAGVYATKMIPNNQAAAQDRFRRLTEAIKFVYASTYFAAARSYFQSLGREISRERMGVIIQEVVGYRHGARYYPTVSAVARSYNYYPTGNARPTEGVVTLALGLGKTIVDGGRTWSYSPGFPRTPPPYTTIAELLRSSQRHFWAVNMGTPREYDPVRETEYLLRGSLQDAEEDGTLSYVCSTYDPASDRLQMGTAAGSGPRLVDFSPILAGRLAPLNELIVRFLRLAEDSLGTAAEIELAFAFDPKGKREARLGFLQIRPMALAGGEGPEVYLGETEGGRVLLSSKRAVGHGVLREIRDIVYVRPQRFRAEATPQVAREVEALNDRLTRRATPYVLIGAGRWGSADPWLGIPVRWSQIGGARVLVETTLPQMSPELSQGSHFFHNMTALGVLYLCTGSSYGCPPDWEWLEDQPGVQETQFLRHVRCRRPVTVAVDGRVGEGVILK